MKIIKAKYKWGITKIELSNGSKYEVWQNSENNFWYIMDCRDGDVFDRSKTKKELINYLKDNDNQ